MKKTDCLLKVLLYFVLLLSLIPVAGSAEDKFTMERVPGATQKDVIVNGERRVIYCMQYDYLWPVTGEGYMNPPTHYEKAASIDLLNADQQAIIQRVLYAGYPFDALGALKPLYEAMGTDYGAEFSANLTQAMIWSFMADWKIPGNEHYVPFGEQYNPDIPGWDEAYAAILDYARYGEKIPQLPEGFTPEITGNTLLTKHDDSWKTSALSITNPTGLKVKYQVTVPDGAVVLNQNGEQLYPEGTFIGSEWVDLGYMVYGGDSFYVQTWDIASAEKQPIAINGSASLPTSITEYKTDESGWGDKGEGSKQIKF